MAHAITDDKREPISEKGGVPIFWLVHPDDCLNRGINLEERAQQAEKWLEFAQFAKKSGIFVPIFSSLDGEVPVDGDFADLYKSMIEEDSTDTVRVVCDDFVRIDPDRGVLTLARLGGYDELPQSILYGPINETVAGLQESLGQGFAKVKHIVGGFGTSDCLKSFCEMLAYGIGVDGAANESIPLVHPAGSRVDPGDIIIPRQYIQPTYDEVVLDCVLPGYDIAKISTDPRTIKDIVTNM